MRYYWHYSFLEKEEKFRNFQVALFLYMTTYTNICGLLFLSPCPCQFSDSCGLTAFSLAGGFWAGRTGFSFLTPYLVIKHIQR